MVKRSIDVKDMGSVLPGHGGMLDRINGFSFALPALYFTFRALACCWPPDRRPRGDGLHRVPNPGRIALGLDVAGIAVRRPRRRTHRDRSKSCYAQVVVTGSDIR